MPPAGFDPQSESNALLSATLIDMIYNASDHDALYRIATGRSKDGGIRRHPIVEVTEDWVKAQKAPGGAGPDEEESGQDGVLYLNRKVLESGEPARNGKAHSVFFLHLEDARAHL